jgi:exo-1,4-beta-D-glucosaminidase
LIAASWRDQVLLLRHHPSIVAWAGASDLLPHPGMESRFLAILRECDPTRPYVCSAAARVSRVSGKSGMKMAGPYDWVPPVYWTLGHNTGFNTETGPGPQVPVLSSLRRMLAPGALWPVGTAWEYHCARGRFHDLAHYDAALNRRLGPCRDAAEYCRKAQFLNYEGVRAMFEAFMVGDAEATGVVHWMANSAWPKLWWQLYDYFLMPTGAFYGARQANAPLHLVYDYGRHRVLAVNRGPAASPESTAELRLFDAAMRAIWQRSVPVRLQPGEVREVAVLPPIDPASPLGFLDLRLPGVNPNFYCIPAKPDVLDRPNATWFVTPVREHADLTALNALAPARLSMSCRQHCQDDGMLDIAVDIANPSTAIAFFVELTVAGADGATPIAPVFWDDNYISLLPGETRQVKARLRLADLRGAAPRVTAAGWNTD